MSAGLRRRTFITRVVGLGALTVLSAGCGPEASTSPPTRRVSRIGYLAPRNAECEDPNAWQIGDSVAIKIGESLPPTSGCQAATLLGSLAERGYRQGDNLEFIVAGVPRYGGADAAAFAPAASELVARRVDIIVTVGADAALAAKQVTTSIPVFVYRMREFVENGIVPSLARPGGNVTGVSLQDAAGKYSELLREAFPWVKHAIVIHGPTPSQIRGAEREAELATQLGIASTLVVWRADDADFVAQAQGALSRGADAVIFLAGTTRPPVVKSVIRQHRLASVGGGLKFEETGNILAFVATGQVDSMAAEYIDRILKGADPGELPVITTTHFAIYVNLKLAAELGLTVAPSVVARATTVIK